ncbi:MAG: hypothetical protein LBQ54_16625 [Planctomycetaceae bacterium]|nr:hypothetical protein [Planctomycetaceae bacterium]
MPLHRSREAPAGRDAAAGGSLPTPSVWSASVGKIFPTEGEPNEVSVSLPGSNAHALARRGLPYSTAMLSSTTCGVSSAGLA